MKTAVNIKYLSENYDIRCILLERLCKFRQKVAEYVIEIAERHELPICNIQSLSCQRVVYDILQNEKPDIVVAKNNDIIISTSLAKKVFTSGSFSVSGEYIMFHVFYKTLQLDDSLHVRSNSLTSNEIDALQQKLTTYNEIEHICIGRKFKIGKLTINNCFGVAARVPQVRLTKAPTQLLPKITLSKLSSVQKRNMKLFFKEHFVIQQCNLAGFSRKSIYLDFEFCNNIYDDFLKFPQSNDLSMIFMIGIGFVDSMGTWKKKTYTARYLTKEEETIIVNKWIKDMRRLHKAGYQFVVHWSNAEPRCLSTKALESIRQWFTFVDLMNVFRCTLSTKEQNISLSLKKISSEFQQCNHIQTTWTDNKIRDGTAAMTAALLCHKAIMGRRQKERFLRDFDVMKSIEIYNDIDCKVLYEILRYILNG